MAFRSRNNFSSGLHKKQFTFFRPSEYISQDFKQYGVSKEKTESRIDVKEKFKDDEIYKDREEQIKAIEKTFEDALVSFIILRAGSIAKKFKAIRYCRSIYM